MEDYTAARKEHRCLPRAQMPCHWGLGEEPSERLPQLAKVGKSLCRGAGDKSRGPQAWICRRYGVQTLMRIQDSSQEYHSRVLNSSSEPSP